MSPRAARVGLRASAVIAIVAIAITCNRYAAKRIERIRLEIGFHPIESGELPNDPGAGTESWRAAVIGTTLGIARPLVIDYLALRAEALEREGRIFESASLSRALVALVPRIPSVWVFHAEKLAYDISPKAPLRDRYDWIEEAIRLLRDDAPAFGVTDPRIRLALARIYFVRIGGDFDRASTYLKAELARRFEPPDELEGEAAAAWSAAKLAEAQLDPERLRTLGREAGAGRDAPLLIDLRNAASHALYWADAGLDRRRDAGESTGARNRAGSLAALDRVRSFAWRDLARRGAPLRQPFGRLYAFLPDLRFLPKALASFDEELERAASDPALRLDVEEDLAVFSSWVVVSRLLWNDRAGALELLSDHPWRDSLGDDLATFVYRFATRDEPVVERSALLAWAVGFLRTELALRLVEGMGEAVGSRDPGALALGIHRIAEDLLRAADESSNGTRELPMAALRDRIFGVLLGRWRRDPKLAPATERLSEAMQIAPLESGGDGRSPAPLPSVPGLEGPVLLPASFFPFHLEALDPELEGAAF